MNLLEIPAARRDLDVIGLNATLREALARMNEGNVDALCVHAPDGQPRGLLLREDIEQRFRHAGGR